MTRQGHDRAATCVVAVASFALLFGLMDRRINVYDEGLVLVDAVRMLHGDVIHRDFYSNYGPGTSGLLALLFRIDDHWFLIARLFGIAVMAAIPAVAYRLLRNRVRAPLAWATSALLLAWLLGTPFYLYPVFPCVLLALIGSGLLLRWRARRRTGYLLLAGAVTGATALFRYDVGFFLAVSHVACLACLILGATTGERRARTVLRSILLYGSGCFAVFAPFAAWYLAIAPVGPFVDDIVGYPLHHYVAMRGLPFPGPAAVMADLSLLGVYMPVVVVLLAAVELLRRRRDEAEGDARAAFLLLFAMLTAVFYYKGVVRVGTLHMMMAILPSLLVAAVLAEGILRRSGRSRLPAIVLIAAIAMAPVTAAIRRVGEDLRDGHTPVSLLFARPPAALPGCTPPPAIALAIEGRDYRAISDALRRASSPNDAIFVGLDRHDRMVVNPVALYFTAGRRPGTHWHHFDPGLQTRRDIQVAMIADLQHNGVRWIVRDASFADVHEPNGSDISSGVHLLDAYIARRYRPVMRSGPVSLWLDKRAPIPRYLQGSCAAPSPAGP